LTLLEDGAIIQGSSNSFPSPVFLDGYLPSSFSAEGYEHTYDEVPLYLFVSDIIDADLWSILVSSGDSMETILYEVGGVISFLVSLFFGEAA
jgi:hypothetical protein